MKQWRQFPKRECKRAVVDICSICGVDIIKGQKYFDKGTFQRVHEHCAPPEIKEAELPASDNNQMDAIALCKTIYDKWVGDHGFSTYSEFCEWLSQPEQFEQLGKIAQRHH